MPLPLLAAADDLAGMINLDQMRGYDLRKGDPKRVHPKGRRVDWVADGDVACYTLLEAVFAEDAKGECEAVFEIVALLELGGEVPAGLREGGFHFR